MYKYIVIFIIILTIIIILAKYIDYYLYKYFYKLYIFETKSNNIQIMNKYNTNNNNKVISISLFGDNPYYYNYAYKIKDDLPRYFPNWELRIYIHYKTPEFVIKKFIDKGCQVIIIKQDNMTPSDSTFWRFLAAQDDVIFISRDADYQLNDFDYQLVNMWLEDKTYFMKYLNKDFLINLELKIRKIHSPFYAGFWGGRNRCVPDMLEQINNYKYRKHWRRDEIFLETIIWERYITKRSITIFIDNKLSKNINRLLRPYVKIRQLDGINKSKDYVKSQSLFAKIKKLFSY